MRGNARLALVMMVGVLSSAFMLSMAVGANEDSPDVVEGAARAQLCPWIPGDPHKMHFPQLPDPTGWDVNGTDSIVLADDWRCTETGPVTDFHWWGSWRDGVVGPIQHFNLKIYSDVPADQSPLGYSMPGELLWEFVVTEWEQVQFDPTTLEGWYDPSVEDVRPNNHQQYFQYDVCIPPTVAFIQQIDSIYWFSVSAVLGNPQETQWGWKSTQNHFNDDAVWAYDFQFGWIDIFEPTPPITNDYFVTFDEFGNFLTGGGSDFYGNGWYEYPSGWWNIWFYDHPFTYENKKTIHIEFDVAPAVPGVTQQLTFAVNWSTDRWSLDQPPADSMPPLPGTDEALYIGRATLLDTTASLLQGHFVFDFEIHDYNPEWVSIDVQGQNFQITGLITHACRPSLDLAFVITGEGQPRGACCYDDPTGLLCVETTQDSCLNIFSGTYQGDGTSCAAVVACCLPTGDCIMADALCCINVLGGTPQGPGSQCSQPQACCLNDGTCITVDPLCCDDLGGTPQPAGTQCSQPVACCLATGECVDMDPLCCEQLGGIPSSAGVPCSGQTVACCFTDGSCLTTDEACCQELGGTPSPTGQTVCLGDNNGNMIDDACEEQLEGACCLQDGSCFIMPEAQCLAAGGTYNGDGTSCAGDNNGNGIDDACEDTCSWEPGDPHKMHFPQLPDELGWDVNATGNGVGVPPLVLADDWMCSDSGWVKDIHFWGSWMHGAEGQVLYFILSIHSDIPADPPSIPYSRPGPALWEREISDFSVTPFDPSAAEGWYDPATGQFFFDDHQAYFRYDICLDSLDWFWQNEGTIYWLNISAIVANPTSTAWGWKSSIDHWNDDAVWAFLGEYFWIDLFEPPDFIRSLDLSFVITGGEVCDCVPGDADGNGILNISDGVYLINFIFGGGPPPTPYQVCNGDADCNCIVNISDAVFMINYIFGGGPAPCSCEDWLANCGPPLY